MTLAGASVADPNPTTKPAVSPSRASEAESRGASGSEVVSRDEMVSELETILRRWEAQSDQYATKSDLQPLRSLVIQMREELDALNAREGKASDTVLEEQQRTDNLARPGF